MRNEVFLYDASQLADIFSGSGGIFYESGSALIVAFSKYFPNDQFFDLLLDLQFARRQCHCVLFIFVTDLVLFELAHQPLALLYYFLCPALPSFERLFIVVGLL